MLPRHGQVPRVPPWLAHGATLWALFAVAAGVDAQAHGAPGVAVDALPGIEDVAAPIPAPAALSAGLDYGRLGRVPGAPPASYQRIGLRLAGAMPVLPNLSVGAQTLARMDTLEGDGTRGLVRSELVARMTGLGSEVLWLGGQLGVRVPGTDRIGGVLDGLGFELTGQLGLQPTPALTLLAELGFRLDRAAGAIEDVENLPTADRVALGVSDSHAIPVGMGLAYRLAGRDVSLLGEWHWEPRVGGEAPRLAASTMWWRFGARTIVLERLQVSGFIGLNTAGLPVLEDPGPPQEVGARLGLWARAAWLFGARAEPAAPRADAPAQAQPPAVQTLTVQVLDLGQAPLAAARVRASGVGVGASAESGADGVARLPGLQPGTWTLSVEAEGYESTEVQVALPEGGEGAPTPVQLRPALPPGHIRGTVRDFRGDPVEASVVVHPLGETVETNEFGEFRLDVPPGEYTVTVTAEGYGVQERPARVEQNGVTVILVDLRRQR